MSLDDFKEIKQAKTLEVKKNLRTGKTFFSAGEETGECFFLLHSREEGGTTVLATL